MRWWRGAAVLALAAALPGWAQAPAPVGQKAQQTLRTTILQTLINDPELGQYALAASVDVDFHVLLQGILPSKADKDLATHLVKSIPGVNAVDNRIEVDASVAPLAGMAPAAAPAAPASAGPTAADVQAAVANALGARPELAHVTVRVAQRQVTLAGTVASQQDRTLAGDVAQQNAAGMKVVNQLEIKHSGG